MTQDQQDKGASANAGFDPLLDGFPLSRLLMAATSISAALSKEIALMGYGAWNPNCMARDASDDAVRLFTELGRHMAHYEKQAAIAIEARSGETGTDSTEGKSAGPQDIAQEKPA